MDRRCLCAVLVFLHVLHQGHTCEVPTDINENFEKITDNVAIRTCIIRSTDKKWKDGESLRISECLDGVWTELDGGCTSSDKSQETCDPTARPDAPRYSVVLWESDTATVYGCNEGRFWHSGKAALATQCIGETWTAIDDYCPVVCPEGFVSVQNETSCLFFSFDAPSLGLAGAALSCGRRNSSLALIKSVSDLDTALASTFYYTAHNFRGDPYYMPAIPSVAGELTCQVDCQATPEKECVAVASDGTYRVQSCTDMNTHYICMFPAYCPEGYSEYLGHCYKVIPAGPSVTSSLQECAKEGSDLAYPENMHTLQFLADLVKTYAGQSGSETLRGYVGVNNLLGWHDDNIFQLDSEILEFLDNSKFFASVMVEPSLDYSFNITAVGAEVPAGSYAICKLYGILGRDYIHTHS
ncbi:uncharacterized protein LOC122244632, partial [Penaeus japonicus]|uniref:uncharacterized protein LOC122244632 n=1 Tax=Penaeus japonicus TaxID=27405 RepID=UPI001C710605